MRRAIVALAIAVCMTGCASAPKKNDGAHIDVVTSPTDPGSDFYALDDDGQKISQAMQMVHSGKIQAAIDGPINEVIAKFEKEYLGKRVYSARSGAEGVMYGLLGSATGAKAGEHIIVVGPSWAMAYWARSYALTEMNRTTEAEADLRRALRSRPWIANIRMSWLTW